MSQVKTIKWFSVELTFPLELEDIISGILWEEGTSGITTIKETSDSITLQAYFDQEINLEDWKNLLENILSELGYTPDKLKDLKLLEVANEDWLKKWKEGYRPVEVGEKFLIVPSWLKSEVTNTSRFIIEIDPGMAFGTGTHETTQLCLRAIEQYFKGGNCLDVGCGTAILAMAAAKLSPTSEVFACDNDPEAVMVAGENLEINQVDKLIKLSVGSAKDYVEQKFSLVVANLTADVIASIIDDLIACQALDGYLILSGILDTQEEQVSQLLKAKSQKIVELLKAGEWIAIVSNKS
ncbi:MAG: 50S ribosomal protein L11 methyltransferase [Acidobacteria bacterium]|nr:50S ribosomal protein L11 methyltransferase [Acidobacteriota bacterium]